MKAGGAGWLDGSTVIPGAGKMAWTHMRYRGEEALIEQDLVRLQAREKAMDM